MTEDADRPKKPAALRKLADHLAALNARDDTNLPMESDMLSLIVSGTLNGEDVSSRYPAFHQKLLEDPGLRQAFLDALESVEAERAGQQVSLPGAPRASLDFLLQRSPPPTVENLGGQTWRAVLQRSLEEIRSVFSPPELAYRADTDAVEDPWFTLLRQEVTAAGTTFDVALECTLSSEMENALSAYMNIAISLGSRSEPVRFPLRASLRWGTYQESIPIPGQGRAKFPDIPLAGIFDPSMGQIQAGFDLILETTS
jgi:hypothetical protein